MALTQQDVQAMIDAATASVRSDMNTIIQADGQAVVQEIAAHRTEIASHRAAHLDTEQRISGIITAQNAKNAELVREITAHKNEIIAQQQQLKIQQDRAVKALEETQNLDSRLNTLNEKMNLLGRDAKDAIDKVAADAEVTKNDILEEFEFRKIEMTQWSDGLKDQSGPPGLGGGKGKGGGVDKNIDKKEIAVWKIPDEVDNTGFRNWVEVVDMQLELVHGMK